MNQSSNKSTFALALVLVCTACGSDDPRGEAASYAGEVIACTTDADCCAVFDQCLARALIVERSDRDTVASLLDGADDPAAGCLDCIRPAVQVRCDAGRCATSRLELDASTSTAGREAIEPFAQTHCGALPIPEGWQARAVPASDGTVKVMTAVGCGP